MEYNGTKYWYGKNLQGDIVGIRNASGTLVAQYEYDAWGKHIRITDGSGNDVSDNPNHIANINPFRYRGYYFDVETGWYYLNARYYDPNVGRFLSPDNASLLFASPLGLTDKNLYSYCDNNPVIRSDNNGELWHIVVGSLLGGIINSVVQVASNVIEGKDAFEGVGTAFVSGMASGAVSSSGFGIVASTVINASISMTKNTVDQVIENEGFDNFDVGEMFYEGAIGGISSVIGGGGTGSKHLSYLGKQTVKRTWNTATHKGVKAGVKELGKAFSYYSKSTKLHYQEVRKSIKKDIIIELSISIGLSDFMKRQYKKMMYR